VRGGNVHRQVTILVMSPHAEERQRLEALLQGHAEMPSILLAASTVEDAMNLFRQHHPDLVIISADDLKTVGADLCDQIRTTEVNRHTGIIFIDRRAVDDGTLSVECLEMGGDDFLRHTCGTEELRARVRAVLRLKAMTDELRSANHRLRVLSMTDELTGLANMRSFNQRFSESLRHCRAGMTGIGVLMLDLDHFKTVNDTTNHLIGSYVIAEVGRIIRMSQLFSESDTAARYGGDEFIIAVEVAQADELKRRAEALRALIAMEEFKRDGCSVRITASIGFAWTAPGFHGRAEDVIKAADLMLYRSKDLGRDRVSGMLLKYPVDLENVSRRLLIDDNTEEQDDKAPRVVMPRPR
jgi:diguanylate cyclase (GGDEF)-like protein